MIVEGDAILIPPQRQPSAHTHPGSVTAHPHLRTFHHPHGSERRDALHHRGKVRRARGDIQAASNIEAGTTMIQVGEVLQIPHYTPTPPCRGDERAGTPTPQAVYAPPALLYPSNGMVFTGTKALIVLQWAATGILEEQEYYRVEFTAPTAGGTP